MTIAMLQGETAVPVIGAAFSNPQGAARRAAIARCAAGEHVSLQREPRAVGGAKAVGVYSARGEQIGYIDPQQVDVVAGQIAVARAIFQRADAWGAVIRLRLDGRTPALPQPPPEPCRAYLREPEDEFCDILPKPRRPGKRSQRLA